MNVTTNLLWEVLATALPYRETWRRRIKRQQPVNVSELQSFLVEARSVANLLLREALAGADSQVALGAGGALQHGSSTPRCRVHFLMCWVETSSACRCASTLHQIEGTPLPEMLTSRNLTWLFPPGSSTSRLGGSTRMTVGWSKGAPSADDFLPFYDICGSQEIDLSLGRKARTRDWHARKAASGSASDANLCEKGNWEASGKGTDHVAVPVQDEGNPFGYSKMRTLTNEAVAMLESFPSFPQRHFFFAEGVCGFFDAGGLDLYSGNYGVAKQMVKFGAPWVLTFEWKRSSSEDLMTCARSSCR